MAVTEIIDPYVLPTYSRDGVHYRPQTISARQWLDQPHASREDPRLAAFLAQLEDDGFLVVQHDTVFIDWDSVYRLIDDPDYPGADIMLGLPPPIDLRPVLTSKGGLTDSNFNIALSGWVDARGIPVPGQVAINGAIVTMTGGDTLLPVESWRVLTGLAQFHARPPASRTPLSNQEHWAHLRREAVAAGAQFSDFLKKSVVLTPEMLRIGLSRIDVGDTSVVEVSPSFEEAPPRWLEIFDRFQHVPERYDIPDGSNLVQVLISPEVRTVLSEIKRMPGRRVAGERGEAFVRNPFAVLGPDAAKVISPEQFEATRIEAGLSFCTFSADVVSDEHGQVQEVALDIEQASGDDVAKTRHVFASPEELERFTTRLAERLRREAQCVRFAGRELEILGDTSLHLDTLRAALKQWLASESLAAEDVLDLERYSTRIDGFGAEERYNSPFIARKNEDGGWFPENLEIRVTWPAGDDRNGNGEAISAVMTPERIAELERAIEQAREKLEPVVKIPGTASQIPLKEAALLLRGVLTAAGEIGKKHGAPPTPAKGEQEDRIHLKLKSNIDQLDYQESRAGLLQVPDDRAPVLPSSLRAGVTLRAHQLAGIAWLQHLWAHSPEQCRGALLADDMGLGKTIQLLTFIARCLESESDFEPVLVVAPVALLENWREEVGKFFVPGALPILTLYGETLASKRLPQAAIDEQLRQSGLTRLLRKDWRGDAKIVLVTYETLRDLEFSLAAEKWSVMVCDEAQKIKNPNAMVTRAAKKQNVRFRIACTGTPVENTLTDLWCLFDFIQPGLLGALTEFGEHYRKPIEAATEEEQERIAELRERIAVQLLRRTKKDVAKDLPEKLEQCHPLRISPMQLRHYSRVMTEIRKAKDERKHLEMIQVLRRVISDPFAFDVAEAETATVEEILEHNPKMRWLIEVLRDIRVKDEKAIVFCEFRDLQRMIQRCISRLIDLHADIVNGDTTSDASSANSRQKRIKRFQEKPGFGVIILSPLAVGFGVNIQAANHVIHFSRTWNPAKEDQATDRAYRIGQTRDVSVHYPIVGAEGFKTFDQKLHELLTWKRSLSADMLNGSGELKAEDFVDLEDVR